MGGNDEEADEGVESGCGVRCAWFVFLFLFALPIALPLSLHLDLALFADFADGRCAAIWEFQARHQGKLPSELEEADELEAIANKMIKEADVNKQILTVAPRDLIE